jgi:hypothetical protein
MTMGFRQLFNIPVGRPVRQLLPGEAKLAAGDEEKTKGVFLTTQSILTFPGATGAVLLIWSVFGFLAPTWGKSVYIPFVWSLLAGLFIWWVGITDPKTVMTRRDKGIAAAIAGVNSFQVFAAVLGLPHP